MEISSPYQKNALKMLFRLFISVFVLYASCAQATILGIGDGFLFGEKQFESKTSNHEDKLHTHLQPRMQTSANGPSWFFLNLNHFVTTRLTENLESSWLAQLYPKQKIYFSGQFYGGINGVIEGLPEFTDVVWTEINQIIISFGLGDWCGQGVFELRDSAVVYSDYVRNISALSAYLAKFKTQKFQIIVVAPFSIQTLYFEKNLKSKKRSQHSDATCVSAGLIQGEKSSDFDVKKMLFDNLVSTSHLRYCPRLYLPGENQERLVSQLANNITQLRKELLKTNFDASQVKVLDLSGLIFDTADLSSNCITFSNAGHERITNYLQAIFKPQFKVD